MRPAPSQFTDFVIGAAAQYDGIAIRKLLVQLSELGNFCGADERKVFRVKVDDFPLAGKTVLGNSFERAFAFFLVGIETRLHAGNGKFWQSLSNTFHNILLKYTKIKTRRAAPPRTPPGTFFVCKTTCSLAVERHDKNGLCCCKMNNSDPFNRKK
jgi:hypothetical protein